MLENFLNSVTKKSSTLEKIPNFFKKRFLTRIWRIRERNPHHWSTTTPAQRHGTPQCANAEDRPNRDKRESTTTNRGTEKGAGKWEAKRFLKTRRGDHVSEITAHITNTIHQSPMHTETLAAPAPESQMQNRTTKI